MPGMFVRPISAMLSVGTAMGCWAQVQVYGQNPADLFAPDVSSLGDSLGGPNLGVYLAAYCFMFAAGAGRFSLDTLKLGKAVRCWLIVIFLIFHLRSEGWIARRHAEIYMTSCRPVHVCCQTTPSVWSVLLCC